jgi:hypothetical protein
MKLADVAHLRTHNQGIASSAFKKPAEVVSWLGAMQAQDFLGAKWSVGLRLKSATESDVTRALSDGSILRTWPMRGTLHFVAPRDIRWMLELLNPRVIASAAGRHKQLGITDALLKKSRSIFTKALRGGKQLTREQMREALERGGISTAGQRGIHIIGWNAQNGLICFGPPQEKQKTFVLLDEWVKATPPLQHEQALTELATRYFVSHGPATLKDFVWWSGLKISDARRAIELASSRLVSETIEATQYWMGKKIPRIQSTELEIKLLPGFDEYILGYTDRSAVLDSAHKSKIYSSLNLIFSPTILINGRVEGTWRRTITSKKVAVALKPFRTLTKRERDALHEAAERYGAFLGRSVVVS